MILTCRKWEKDYKDINPAEKKYCCLNEESKEKVGKEWKAGVKSIKLTGYKFGEWQI